MWLIDSQTKHQIRALIGVEYEYQFIYDAKHILCATSILYADDDEWWPLIGVEVKLNIWFKDKDDREK